MGANISELRLMKFFFCCACLWNYGSSLVNGKVVRHNHFLLIMLLLFIVASLSLLIFCTIAFPGYTGQYCEENIDDCTPDSCTANTSVCIDMLSEFFCRCPIGWSGDRCQKRELLLIAEFMLIGSVIVFILSINFRTVGRISGMLIFYLVEKLQQI